MQVSSAPPTKGSAAGLLASYVTDADSLSSRLDRYLYGGDVHRTSAGRRMTTNWIVAVRRAANEHFFATPLRDLAIKAISELPGAANPEISWEELRVLCVSFTWHGLGEPDLSDAYLANFGLMRSWVDLHCRIRSPKLGSFVPAPAVGSM